MFNTLKAIHTKNLMKHFMTLQSSEVTKTEEKQEKQEKQESKRGRSFKINGSARKSVKISESTEEVRPI